MDGSAAARSASMSRALPSVEEGIPPWIHERSPASPRPRPRVPVPSAGLRLPDAPAFFPWLARRFTPGEATLMLGSDALVSRLLEFLYAGTACVRGRVSLLEAANRIHPYRAAEWGRTLGVDPSEVLRRVRVARAFTAYQLVALVDGWAREIRRSRPTLLVAHDLPALFEGEEVPIEARAPLLGHIAERLKATAEATRIPMIMTLSRDPTGFPGLFDRGPRLADVIRLRSRDGSLRLEAYREVAHLALVARPDGQRGIEEFDPDPGVEEVNAQWDAPHRRTVRR